MSAKTLRFYTSRVEDYIAALNMLLVGRLAPVFWAEVALGLGVPFGIFATRLRARRGWLLAGASLALLGVLAKRVNILLPALYEPLVGLAPGIPGGRPGQPFTPSPVYQPTWVEWGVLVGILALAAGLITLGVRRFVAPPRVGRPSLSDYVVSSAGIPAELTTHPEDEQEEPAMRVRDVMTRRLVTVTPRTSIMEARRLLAAHRVRHLVVIEAGRVVGMLSDRDLLVGDEPLAKALAALASDLVDGRYRHVGPIMSAPAVVIDAGAPVATAARVMRARRISALPVIEHGRPVGIVTTTDLLRALEEVPAPVSDRDLAREPIETPLVPMGPGDERPGRPAPRPVAVVIDPDDKTRLQLATELRGAGYEVSACPGPIAGVRCPACDGAPDRCPRVPPETELVIVDQASARTGLLEAYVRWVPNAAIEVTGTRIEEETPA